ncbi:MAG: GNAT family N-acetyltransferase [Phycisphaeraceae bacterium]|nr:GNAT family N-acetyltransferase [Phycisphaeraceae bacterium]
MTRSAPNPPARHEPSPGFAVVRVGEELLLAAAQRLVSQSLKDRQAAAKRLISSAPEHGIDLSCIWASVSTSEIGKRSAGVRQACLAVPGSGRTAMIFISEPSPSQESAAAGPRALEEAREERIALLNAVGAHFSNSPGTPVRVLQALPEPSDAWAESAFRGAGFVCVGDLEYRRRSLAPVEHKPSRRKVEWPTDVRVAPLSSLPQPERDPVLLRVLDESYVETLDCPELCGMRATSDILASHYATGVFDPSIWFVVFIKDPSGIEHPAGCMLLNRVIEQRALELVYVGLAKGARGRGIGAKLMELALISAAEPRIDAITCAVDCRNLPAIKMYERFGFAAIGRRRAFVRSVNGNRSG